MTLPGVTLIDHLPKPAIQLGRADVAMFAGLVFRERAPLPERLRGFLADSGWIAQNRSEQGDREEIEMLLGLPVPVESWDEFTALYRWDGRVLEAGAPEMIPTNLGLAVRSFFAEGGRKAYILRTGDPMPLVDYADDAAREREKKRILIDGQGRVRLPHGPPATGGGPAGTPLNRIPLLPGFIEPANEPDPGERKSWMGAAAIYGVDDAAMLLLPDLAELCSGRPERITGEAEPAFPPEDFKPCAPALPAAEPDDRPALPALRAPRLSATQYGEWSAMLAHLLHRLGTPRGPAHRRDVMLVAALPLPLASSGLDRGEESNPLLLLAAKDAVIPGTTLFATDHVGSARLQLAYPWAVTQASRRCPEGVESPEGAFAGLVAKRALAKGAFHSAAGQEPLSLRGTVPTLGSADLRSRAEGNDWLGERICLFGPRHGRVTLLSDATTSASPAWRAGGVSRLMNIVLRAARHIGQDLVFEASGPRLWAQLTGAMERFLQDLAGRGALTTIGNEPAFAIRCDRTTMTQNDIDNGRVVMTVAFTAAFPVERILVTLNLVEPPPASSGVSASKEAA